MNVQILPNGKFVEWEESWGRLCNCKRGKWALDDSTLYLEYQGQRSFEKEGINPNWAIISYQDIQKIYSINKLAVTFSGGREKITFYRSGFLNDSIWLPCTLNINNSLK
jgi:hypothetical protein